MVYVAVIAQNDGLYSVAYFFTLNNKQRFRNDVLKQHFKNVKAKVIADYSRFSCIGMNAISVEVTEAEIKAEHKAIAADSYDLSLAKQGLSFT